MFRTFDIIMIVALVASAAWTFKVKYDSENAMAALARLERRIQIEKEAIDILKADWSLLTSPERLEKLTERYRDDLGLEPVAPKQIGTLREVPDRAPPPVQGEEGTQAQAELPDAQAITGAIALPEPRQ